MNRLFVDLWPGWVAGAGISGVVFCLLYFRNRNLAVSSCYAYLTDRISGRAAVTASPASATTAVPLPTCGDAPPLPTCGDTMEIAAIRKERIADATGKSDANATPAWTTAFLIGILLGGAVAGLLARAAGEQIPFFSWAYPGFDEIMKVSAPVKAGVLFGGGLLIGFGTRMAGGCTSGHAIMGAPALQKGSLIAMGTFFGSGIVFTFVLRALVAG